MINSSNNIAGPSASPVVSTEMLEYIFGHIIVALAFGGLVVNTCALVILYRRRLSSVFHQLLRFLSIYDILVGLSGCLTYGLPPLWETYSYEVLPRIAPWLIPLIHAALMTSVYCTVILSLERYVRICYLCQLRDWSYPYVTEKNVHFYKIGLILLPILFYMPKFFEVSWVYHKVDVNVTVDCDKIMNDAASFFAGNISDSKLGLDSVDSAVAAVAILKSSHLSKNVLNCISHRSRGLNRVVVTQSRDVVELVPTDLRMSPIYYKLYCVFLNSFLASFLPLAALLYLNVCTVRVLRKMTNNRQHVFCRSSPKPFSANEAGSGSQSHVWSRSLGEHQRVVQSRSPHQHFFQVKSPKINSKLRRSVSEMALRSNAEQQEVKVDFQQSNGSLEINEQRNGKPAVLKVVREISPHHLNVELKDPIRSVLTTISSFPITPEERFVVKDEERFLLKRNSICSKSNEPKATTFFSMVLLPNRRETHSAESNRNKNGIKNEILKVENGDFVIVNAAAECHPSPAPRSSSHPRCPQFQDRAMSTASELNAMNRNSVSHSHAQEQRLARISTSIVWLFILCHLWRMIPTVYEYWNSENGLDVPIWPYSLVVVEHISHSLILFNSAVNFLIYVFM